MDVSDDMSPNATSTGDEKELGRNTPGVSDEVHRMTLVEEATIEQSMEVELEESEETGEKERKKVRRNQKEISQAGERKSERAMLVKQVCPDC